GVGDGHVHPALHPLQNTEQGKRHGDLQKDQRSPHWLAPQARPDQRQEFHVSPPGGSLPALPGTRQAGRALTTGSECIYLYCIYIGAEAMTEKIARLFVNGGSQAVRLPVEFRFEGVTEVYIRRDSVTGEVILS